MIGELLLAATTTLASLVAQDPTHKAAIEALAQCGPEVTIAYVPEEQKIYFLGEEKEKKEQTDIDKGLLFSLYDRDEVVVYHRHPCGDGFKERTPSSTDLAAIDLFLLEKYSEHSGTYLRFAVVTKTSEGPAVTEYGLHPDIELSIEKSANQNIVTFAADLAKKTAEERKRLSCYDLARENEDLEAVRACGVMLDSFLLK